MGKTEGQKTAFSRFAFHSYCPCLFFNYTSTSELISVDTIHGGMLTELTYSIGMKKSRQIQEFLSEMRNLNGNNKVTLIAGYNSTDL